MKTLWSEGETLKNHLISKGKKQPCFIRIPSSTTSTLHLLSKNLIPSLLLLSHLSLVLFFITLSTHCCFSNAMFHSQTPPFQHTHTHTVFSSCFNIRHLNHTLKIKKISVQHSKALSPTTLGISIRYVELTLEWSQC